jgi:hypothetical protein
MLSLKIRSEDREVPCLRKLLITGLHSKFLKLSLLCLSISLCLKMLRDNEHLFGRASAGLCNSADVGKTVSLDNAVASLL